MRRRTINDFKVLIDQNINRGALLGYFMTPLSYGLDVAKADIYIFNPSPCVRTKVTVML